MSQGPSVIQIIGIAVIVLLYLLMLVNGAVMLFSPSRWFRLPNYIALRGSITRKYGSTFLGRLSIRVTGLALLGVMYMMIGGILGAEVPSFPRSFARSLGDPLVQRLLGLILGVGTTTYGLRLFWRARAESRKWVAENSEELSQRFPGKPMSETTLDAVMRRFFMGSGIFFAAVGLWITACSVFW